MAVLKYYQWIVLECYLKQKTIGNFPNLKLKLPIEFQWAYFLITIKKGLINEKYNLHHNYL